MDLSTSYQTDLTIERDKTASVACLEKESFGAMLDLPIGFDEPVEDEPLVLDDEVASKDAASAFLADVSLRSAQEPFEHDYASVWACETLLDVRRAIGSEGIRAWLDYVDEFGARIEP